MKEIKFRAWDKQEKKMIFDNVQYELAAINKPATKHIRNFIGFNEADFEFFDITQYTGLKDINDNEIYIGDLILWTEGVTFFVDGSIPSLNKLYYRVNHPTRKKVKIIGNIYENPELWKD